MSSVWQDLRHAVRSLMKSPAFALVAVLTVSLGTAASTVMFSVVNGVLLKPLPYPDSEQLVVAWEYLPRVSLDPVGPNPRHVDVWRNRASGFENLTLFRHGDSGLVVGSGHPSIVGTVVCLSNLFDVLHASPFLGRAFRREDGVQGHDRVAILSYRLWQSAFRADPAIVGTTVRLGDVSREVIGVLPATFRFPNANALRAFRSNQPLADVLEPDMFVPVPLDVTQLSWNGEYGNWLALGRLKSGFGIEQVKAQLSSIQSDLLREHGIQPGSVLVSVEPLHAAITASSRTALWFLLAAVIGLVLIGCLNLANAQLARVLSRERETAVRTALGASKWRIIWNVMTEGC